MTTLDYWQLTAIRPVAPLTSQILPQDESERAQSEHCALNPVGDYPQPADGTLEAWVPRRPVPFVYTHVILKGPRRDVGVGAGLPSVFFF